MNEYIEQRKAENVAKGKEMKAIAEHLEGQWHVKWPSYDPDELYNEPYAIENDIGLELWFQVGYNSKDRFHVSPSGWPSYTDDSGKTEFIRPSDLWNPQESAPYMTAARNRGPEAIARDIERKILPEYLRLLDRCRAKAKEWQKRVDLHTSKLSRVAAACHWNKPLNTTIKRQRFQILEGDARIWVQYDSPENVTLQMGADMAVAVIELIEKIKNTPYHDKGRVEISAHKGSERAENA